jgi:hypothetical protein
MMRMMSDWYLTSFSMEHPVFHLALVQSNIGFTGCPWSSLDCSANTNRGPLPVPYEQRHRKDPDWKIKISVLHSEYQSAAAAAS